MGFLSLDGSDCHLTMHRGAVAEGDTDYVEVPMPALDTIICRCLARLSLSHCSAESKLPYSGREVHRNVQAVAEA